LKKYVIKGKNENEILKKVAAHFNVPIDFVKYELVTKDKSFLGKTKEVTLKVWIEKDNLMANAKVEEKNHTKSKIKEKRENHSDDFEFDIRKNGIFLTVALEVKADEESERSLKRILKKREIKNPNDEKVKEALYEKKGEAVKIAEYDKEYYIDSLIRCEVQKNGMEAIIEAHPPIRGNHVTYEQIMRLLQQNGIVYGIKEDAIREVEEDRRYKEVIVVAEGKKPEKGKDAQIIPLFDTSQTVKIEKDDTGRADLKNLNLIVNVEKGDTLAQKIFATDGINGITVKGVEIIPDPGKDKKFPAGKNTEATEDDEFLISTMDGQLTEVNGIISVLPLYEVAGNVDYSVGNVEFNGTVHINGRVVEGFSVKAKGDIIVEEIVEDAILECEGNVTVKKGIIGKEDGKGYIKAKGNVMANFIQNFKVETEGSVEALEHIMHSEVDAKYMVKCLRGKGKIIGGNIAAGKEIAAKYVGSEYGTTTGLNAGVSPECIKQNKLVEKEIGKLAKEKEKIDVETSNLRRKDMIGKLDKKHKTMLLNLTKRQFELNKKLNELRKDKMALSEQLAEGKKGKIHIFNEIYIGAVIKIGESQLITKETFRYATFYYDKDKREIAILPCEAGE